MRRRYPGGPAAMRNDNRGLPNRDLSAARVHLAMWIPPEVLNLEEHTPRWETQAFLGASVGSAPPPGADRARDFFRRGAGTQKCLEVESGACVKAQQPH